MQYMTKIVVSSVHGQGYLHELVRKDVTSHNCRWWVLAPNLLDIIRSLFWLWCKVLGAGAADSPRYLERGRRHTFSSHFLPEKSGLLSRHTNYQSHLMHVHMSYFYLSWSWLWCYPSWWEIMRHEIMTWCNTAARNPASSRYTVLSLLSSPPLSDWI